MKKVMAGAVIAAVGLMGITPAHAADAPTIVLSGGSAVLGLDPATITATLNTAGKVAFSAGGTVITGCEAVASTTVAPFVARCSWKPAAAGAVNLTGVLTPTDSTLAVTTSAALAVKVGVPIQGVISPVNIFVDTVLASGSTGDLAPRFGVSCAVTSQYIIGQTIVFRVYANNSDLGGAVMDSSNTAKAYIEVAGVKDPLPLTYGNHSGVAFWTAVLKTGAAPLYNTLGVINYKVTMVAKDSTTAKTLATKRVYTTVDGVTKTEYVSYYRTVKLRNPIKGATGTWQSNWTATSQLTLYAIPAK